MGKITLIVASVVSVIADTLFVFYAKSKSHATLLLITAIALIGIGSFIWALSMKRGVDATYAITFYALFTVIACSAVGIFIFKESLSPLNIVGMALACVALVLISL